MFIALIFAFMFALDGLWDTEMLVIQVIFTPLSLWGLCCHPESASSVHQRFICSLLNLDQSTHRHSQIALSYCVLNVNLIYSVCLFFFNEVSVTKSGSKLCTSVNVLKSYKQLSMMMLNFLNVTYSTFPSLCITVFSI